MLSTFFTQAKPKRSTKPNPNQAFQYSITLLIYTKSHPNHSTSSPTHFTLTKLPRLDYQF